MKYKVIIEAEPSGGYSAYIPELPGCASQGETKKETIANIKKALKLYLWSIKADKKALERRKIFIKDIAA